MTPEQLSEAISRVLVALSEAGTVNLTDPAAVEVLVERPKDRSHGDWATNVALQLGKRVGMAPRALAELVGAQLAQLDEIAEVDIAGPGFLNIRVNEAAQGQLAAQIISAADSYGKAASTGQKINLEFISANPTGPLHLGHTRWAAVGDALARVLAAAGADVTREFYINDRGNQMDKFGASLMARAAGEEPPEDGYLGAYVAELAQQVVDANPGIEALPAEERLVAFREAGYTTQLAQQKQELDTFRTHFDVWFSERSLHENNEVDATIETLTEQGRVYTKDGASWLRTTEFGDDKDRVLRRSNGELTYFASDTAYYLNKRARGFDRCIYMLGADHHGYVGRLEAMAQSAGDAPGEHIEILIGQLVKILSDGVELKLSKRAGTIVTLAELIELVGVDALRYTLIRYPVDSPLTLDVAEMTKASAENPVYYVQYAHARLSAMLRSAADLGVADAGIAFDPALLVHEREGQLLRALAEFPRLVSRAAELREPHRIARYLEDTASTFHKFYDVCRVLPQGDEEPSDVHRARLGLVAATRQVIANGLDLLGVTAPERM